MPIVLTNVFGIYYTICLQVSTFKRQFVSRCLGIILNIHENDFFEIIHILTVSYYRHILYGASIFEFLGGQNDNRIEALTQNSHILYEYYESKIKRFKIVIKELRLLDEGECQVWFIDILEILILHHKTVVAGPLH